MFGVKNVLRACNHTLGEFISPIFTVPKKDGGIRLILNLKSLTPFKMDNINTILKLITPNCWMAVVDLKDAYHSLPVHPKFTPRKFAKLMKPISAHIHALHHIVSGYIDDFYRQGHTYQKCVENVATTVKILDNVGLSYTPSTDICAYSSTRDCFIGFCYQLTINDHKVDS